MTRFVDSAERTLAVLQWQDRWTVALDDTFLDGVSQLEDALDHAIDQCGFLGLYEESRVQQAVNRQLDSWMSSAVAPQLRTAEVELIGILETDEQVALQSPTASDVVDSFRTSWFEWFTRWNPLSVIGFRKQRASFYRFRALEAAMLEPDSLRHRTLALISNATLAHIAPARRP